MPELPEVETIRRDLNKKLLNKKISSIHILSPKTAKNKAAFFKKNLINQSFEKISRIGKLLYFKVSNGYYLLVHLKMTGQLIYVDSDLQFAGGHSLKSSSDASFLDSVGGALPNRHTRLFFTFSDSSCLYYNDLRKFGYLQIVSEDKLNHILENNYGPEPFDGVLDKEYLAKKLHKRLRPIKSVLLDQKIIAGLGNIYVDEALFLAKIRPEREAGAIKARELKELVKAIINVIDLAISNRGTTFSNYLDSQGKKGNYSALLKVYGRKGKKCFNCSNLIEKTKLSGRGTHYCRHCQK